MSFSCQYPFPLLYLRSVQSTEAFFLSFAQPMSLGPGSQLSHLPRMHDMTQVLRHLCDDIIVLIEEHNISPHQMFVGLM